MNIVFVSGDPVEHNSSVDILRCQNPAKALNRAGHNAKVISLNDFTSHAFEADALCTFADIIVIERNLWADVLETIAYWRAHGKPVIVDFDDAYDLLPFSCPVLPWWKYGVYASEDGKDVSRSRYPAIAQFRDAIQHSVVAATMPSAVLAEDWAWATPCHVLPNFPDVEHYIHRTKTPNKNTIISWNGSNSHFQSWTASGIIPALINVCRADHGVKIVLCGDHERICRQLSAISDAQKELRPWAVFEKWPNPIMDTDLALIPLSGSAGGFDWRRSDVKGLEHLLLKQPFVASAAPPYKKIMALGLNHRFIKNTPEAWEETILYRLAHLYDDQAEIEAGYEYAVKQDIYANIQTYVDTYREIIDANQAAG